MWCSRSSIFRLAVSAFGIVATAQSNQTTEAQWHPPSSTAINTLSSVVNGTGVFGFIFNGSNIPLSTPYGTYNWCNMPHVRAQEYIAAPEDYELVYVELIHRHHKRTPYASNTFPREGYAWDCDDEALFYYGALEPANEAAAVQWQVYTPAQSPIAPAGFNGTCQFPQITAGGLSDSFQHGRDLYGVYHDLLDFLPEYLDQDKVNYRVTNNVITSEVASQVIRGMYPETDNKRIPVLVQPASIDSLEPTYECSAASILYSAYGVGSNDPRWTDHLRKSAALFAKLDSVSTISPNDNDWHESFDHYFDNLSARTCHAKPLPCNNVNESLCVTQTDADAVFRAGEYEYSYIYRDAPQSLKASTASFGIWMAELAENLRTATSEQDHVQYRHNVAHDGSISRLLSVLQIDVMVWPGMGSEVVFELYKRGASWSLRVLWGGKILTSSNPSFGSMNLIPVDVFLDYIDALVGNEGTKVPELCEAS